MSKGPPPQVKPKPKKLRQISNESGAKSASSMKAPEKVVKSNIDSVLSQPISMQEYSETESEEEGEIESSRFLPAPVTPGRKHSGIQTTSNGTIGSPFKQSVDFKTNGFPLPPKRNVGLSSNASPLRNTSLESNTASDFAEGMRSPLKATIKIEPTNPVNSSITKSAYMPPRPPKRSVQIKKVSNGSTNGREVDEQNEGLSPPPLPNRRSTRSSLRVASDSIRDESPQAPGLPKRREIEPRVVTPPLFPDSDVEHDYSDEQEDERSVHVRAVSKSRSFRNSRSQSTNSVSYDYDDQKSDLLSSSSQLFNQAKIFSKDKFSSAKEKSAPYLSKVKGTIKSKLNKDSNPKYENSDGHGDHLYVSQREANEVSSRQSSSLAEPLEDISFDEDRPALPARRGDILPLEFANEDNDLKPLYKVKPPVPAKAKLPPPSKKNSLKPPVAPVSRSRSTSTLSSTELFPSLSFPSTTTTTAAAAVAAAAAPPPPPPPSRARPAVPPSRNANLWKEPKMNLELPTLWFAKDSQLPKALHNMNYQCSHGFVGPKEFKVYAFRLDDLATLRLKLVWKSGSPELYTEEVSFIPPPTVTKKLLTEGHEKFGEHVANWCEVKEGTTVGNGECWTLAHDALEKACGKYAFVSSGLTHGALLATYTASGVTTPAVTDMLRRGDILQFESCVFVYPNRTVSFGAPDHTAIIIDVKPSEYSSGDNRLRWLEIIHQNIGGVKKVRVGDIDLSKLQSGEIRAYRPVDNTWIVPLADVVI